MVEQSNRPLVKEMGRTSAVTPVSLNSGRITRRSSTGSCDYGDNVRSSSEKPDSAKTSQRRIPLYLRASAGSCHDLCKYGRRHAFEEEVIKPIRKTNAKPSLNQLKSKEKIVSGEQTKERVKHKPSVDTEKSSRLVKPSPDAKSFLPKVVASSDAKTHSCKTLSLPNSPTNKSISPEKVPVREGNSMSIDNKMSRGDKKTFDKSSSYVRPNLFKVKPSSAFKNSDREGRRNVDVQTGRKMTASIVSAKKTGAAPLFPNDSLSKTASDKARKTGRVKLLPPGKDQNRTDRVENGTSDGRALEKTLRAIETGSVNHPLESPSSPVSLFHPFPLFNEEDNGGIKYSGDETNESASEIGNVTPVVENHKPLEMETDKNASEFIPDYHANPSPMFHDEEIKYGGSDEGEFVVDKDRDVSMEIDKVQAVKENHYTTLRMETEDSCKSSADVDVIPALPSPSTSKSPSLLSDKEDDEEIKNMVKKVDKLVSGDSVTVKIIKTKPLKGNHSKNLKKIAVVSSGDKYCRPVKLKFKRGKVVDLHHQDSNIPRRLIFRRMRVSGNKPGVSVSDNENVVIPVNESNKNLYSMTLRKSKMVVSGDKSHSPERLFGSKKGVSENNIPLRIRFKRARIVGVGDGKGELKRVSQTEGNAAGAYLSSQNVNLKHHNLQRKKEVQFLLNNVIEETASKLVESRKSKVKALVGAFERVISLQVCTPCLRTASRKIPCRVSDSNCWRFT